jgi:hypothetical protein
MRSWPGPLWLWMTLALLAGCGATAQRTEFDSHASYNRTFDAVVGAMSDQKMTASVVDRRRGQIVAERNGDKVEATLTLLLDGAIRVGFSAQGQPHADAELLNRVVASYNARMGNQSMLGGFKDSGSQSGPVPCPSGPAFCK